MNTEIKRPEVHEAYTTSGWSKPLSSKRWHYFHKSPKSLCKHFFFSLQRQARPIDATDNCAKCRKALKLLGAEGGAA